MFEKRWHNRKPPKGSLLNRAHSLSRNLVGCWLMNEGGGALINNSAARIRAGGAGTLAIVDATNSQWRAGKFGRGVGFDGANDYVSIGSGVKMLGGNAPFTFLAWIRADSGIGTSDGIIWDTPPDQNLLRILNSDNTQAEVLFNSFTTNDRVSSGAGTIVAGIWTQVVGLYDGAQIKIYTQGMLRNSVTPTGTYAAGAVGTFGARMPGSTNFFNGIIGVVMCWQRALTATEVSQLYREPFAMFNKPQIWPTTVAAEGGGAMTLNTRFWGAPI